MNPNPAEVPNDSSPSATALHHEWRWHRHDNHETLSRAVAARVASAVRQQPELLVCLAAGASTERAYELMAAQARVEPALYASVRWLKLDEWGGLAPNDPASCESSLRRVLLDPLGVPPERYCGWASQPADPDAECRRVRAWLDTHGPVDVQILGLGENGHLGFNEPSDVLQPGPHVAQLSATSRSHPMLLRSRSRVTFGLTLGMADIMRSRQIFLLVSGQHKAQQLRRLAMDDISPAFPASLLHQHAAVSIFCDEAATSRMPAGHPAAAAGRQVHGAPPDDCVKANHEP